MARVRLTLLGALALVVIVAARPAQADTPVADPGFAFVDVNGDGLYSASDGDIGLNSTPSVDINALIRSNGVFDTQKDKGNYRAPASPCTLVVPKSQSFLLPDWLVLKAGKDLRIYGRLQAPMVQLASGANTDMSLSDLKFDTVMTATAGGDLTLTGASITGSASTGTFQATSDANIIADQANGFVTSIEAPARITLDSHCLLVMNGTALTTLAPNSAVELQSTLSLYATDGVSVATGDYVRLQSLNEDVIVPGTSLAADRIDVRAAGHIAFPDMSAVCSGPLQFVAGRAITGNTRRTALLASDVTVSSKEFLELTDAALLARDGTITLTAAEGPVYFDGASLTASRGILARGLTYVSARDASLRANYSCHLQADCFDVDASGSKLLPYSVQVSNTYASVQAGARLTMDRAVWAVPETIFFMAIDGNISARSATLAATAFGGALGFYAGGGTIDVTAAMLTGDRVFGPPGVNVIGP